MMFIVQKQSLTHKHCDIMMSQRQDIGTSQHPATAASWKTLKQVFQRHASASLANAPCIIAVLADEQCFPFLGCTNTGHWSGKAGSSFLVCFLAAELARSLLQGLGWMNETCCSLGSLGQLDCLGGTVGEMTWDSRRGPLLSKGAHRH